MANSILPNSSYLLKFSIDQLNDHQELFVIGATLTEWFDHIGRSRRSAHRTFDDERAQTIFRLA